jgi:NDP-sugar pyrophosphorylase family protein
MQAVILAGGLGTRLRPFTEVIPKPLLPIGEKSLLEIQIEHLRRHGCTEVFLATNHKSDYVRNFFGDGSRYGVRLEISEEKIPLGTAGPVTLLRDRLREPFLLMNGDILSATNFRKMYDFALTTPADLTVGIKKLITPFAFGRIHFDGDFVTEVEEKPSFEIMAVAGIYVMKPGIFELIPENQYYGMDTLIKAMLASGTPVAKYTIEEYWLDIGQIPDFERAQEVYREHFAPAGQS